MFSWGFTALATLRLYKCGRLETRDKRVVKKGKKEGSQKNVKEEANHHRFVLVWKGKTSLNVINNTIDIDQQHELRNDICGRSVRAHTMLSTVTVFFFCTCTEP